VIVLPGFPTSAMFTFHDFVVPVLRAMSGLAARRDVSLEAKTSTRILSDLGRTEFVMVALAEGADGLSAFPLSKGSGAVSAFSQADGFLTIDALAQGLAEGTRAAITLFDPAVRVPDLTIMGSHCTGLEAVIDALSERGIGTRAVAIGSSGGLAAAKRGDCDIAPIHLIDPATGVYNRPLLGPGLGLVEGWRRMQGLVFRHGDARFAGLDLETAMATALADPACHMVNRNAGAGTRALIDRLVGARRPPGYWNQPKSHNAVAAAVAQGRADWGIAIAPVAAAYGLSFLPIAEEHYDFAVPLARRTRPAVEAFVAALADSGTRAALRALGFVPAPDAEGNAP
jgi:putative molybdopterin biosynthesis protein